MDTVPLTISYHQFRFQIGEYFVEEIWYFITKRNQNDKNTIFCDEKQKKNLPYWPVM